MSFNGNERMNVRTDGNDLNGGGFRSGSSGVDRSLQAAPHVTFTGAVIQVASSQLYVDTPQYTVHADDIGNIIQISGGTATAGIYVITAVNTAANRWTLDRSIGVLDQTADGRMGGAFASPGKAASFSSTYTSGTAIYIKSGTYSITSATPNVSGGCMSVGTQQLIEGCNAAQGDGGGTGGANRPILQASGISTFTLITASAARSLARFLILDGANLTSSRGMFIRGVAYHVEVRNCNNTGIAGTSSAAAIFCVATGCSSTWAFSGALNYMYGCHAYSNTYTPFNVNSYCLALNCVSNANTGGSTNGFDLGIQSGAIQCVAYGNGNDGFLCSEDNPIFINCIAENNGGYGFNYTGQSGAIRLNNVVWGNTSGGHGGITGWNHRVWHANVELYAGVLNDPVNGDFTLKNDSDGNQLRGAGYSNFPFGTNYPDIGVFQNYAPTDAEIAEAVWTYVNRTLT